MLIRVVDFESTGLPDDPGGASICEAGWCDVNVHDAGAVEVGAPQALFVAPRHPIRPEIRAVHHIKDVELIGAPSSEVALTRLIGDGPDFLCAHNSKFEQAFFSSAPVKMPASLQWICSYKVALRLWPDAPSHSNQVLRYWLNLNLPDEAAAMPPHRAGPDAYVTAHLLARIIEHGGASIEDMVRWSGGPPLLHRLTFGKYKGELWKDLPSDYLNWILTKSDMDGDTKANAKFRLRERGEL